MPAALFRHRPATFAALVIAALSSAATAEPVIKAVKKQKDFDVEYSAASDLSGITWAGDDNYYVVSNRTSAINPLKLKIDNETGEIESAEFGSLIPVNTHLSDFEGIAWQPARERLYISAERGNGIVGFDTEGDARFPVEVPEVFSRARFNRSLESLTFGAGHFWTANEDTLTVDGAASSTSRGGLVRIQKFDESLKPVAQFACRTDPTPVPVGERGTGLTDLCALPDGQLLALERIVSAGLFAKIYLIDFKDATDVSGIKRLEDADFKAVGKKLLFERYTGTDNYEGIALGPELEGGWRSLILVADNGGDSKHEFMPLRIKIEGDKEEEKEE